MNPYSSVASPVQATLVTIGARMAKVRLAKNQTQADLARESGASVSSIKRMEAGENTSLDTFLRVLKALELERRLLDFLPDMSVRPVERIQLTGRERKRAREKKSEDATPWIWGDDK